MISNILSISAISECISAKNIYKKIGIHSSLSHLLTFHTMFKRILLFGLTNIAVIAVLSIIMAIVSRVWGIDMNGESFISLAITSLVI